MMLLKTLNIMNWLKQLNEIKTIDTSDLVKIGEFDTKFREIEKLNASS